MTAPSILIPVKAGVPKSRLSALLNEAQRKELVQSMLMDVLDAFSGVGLLPHCVVISSSGQWRALARSLGARAVTETSDNGVNSAVATGSAMASYGDLMVVPADVPLLRGSEIRRALGLKASGVDVVVSPSLDFDGTNLLIFSRSKPLPLSFDRDSFRNHLGASSRRGYKVAVDSAMGFRFDIDTISHLRALAESRLPCRAAAFAREMVRH